jgi:Na+-driven multidrug efflux pump
MLIFGFGPFPELGVTGAAIATVISRGLTFCFAMYVLAIREKVITFNKVKIQVILESWKTILYIGVPNAIAKMIIPLGVGIITGLVATFGIEVVAGFGVATRVEFLALSVVMALSSVIPVFVGQNFGANKLKRIEEGVKMSEQFSIVFGILMYGLLFVLARPISHLFTQEKIVSDTVVLYLRIVPLGYTFQGILQILNGALNALHQPIKASLLNLTQMLVVYIPLAVWSSKTFGIVGIFVSLVASYFIVGTIGHYLFKSSLKNINTVKVDIIKENLKSV